MAMKDQCPHRLAALSEGRLTASGDLQCAYHGWAFDGATGECTSIPQQVIVSARPYREVGLVSCVLSKAALGTARKS